MALEDIVNITIRASGAGITRKGFSMPLVLAYHTHWSGALVRTYTGLSGMVTDGFSTTEPAYEIASVIFAQSPRPPKIKVARRTRAYTQVIRLTPEAPTTGKVYAVTINDSTVTYTALGGDTLAAVCTALATAISALALVTATGASGTYVDVTTDAAGTLASYADWTDTLAVEDRTANPGSGGIAADLADVLLQDRAWYGLLIDSNSKAEITAAAAWAETQEILFAAQTGDSAAADGASTTDILYTERGLSHFRTHVEYTHKHLAAQWRAAALLGAMMPYDPGSATFAFKTLRGVTPDVLTPTQYAAVLAKNGGIYTEPIEGGPITEQGKAASGEWLDVVVGLDWVRAQMRENLFTVLRNAAKVPYTNKGVDTLEAAVQRTLDAGVKRSIFSDDPAAAPVVTAPDVADVDATDKQNRLLPDLDWSATAAGAIHAANITGTVSP